MDRYVEAPTFVPLIASTNDTVPTFSKDLSQNQLSSATRRNRSDVLYPEALPSPLRPALRIGCTNPRGSMNASMKQKHVWSVFTSPNSFEHLCAEKAYLTASLKNQDDREVGLMRKLSMLQEMIDGGLPSKERRKSRKKAALMKSRIMEAAAQKKAIILRLGEIYVELQSRETWMQIQSELYERRCSLDPHSAPCATTPSDVTSMIPTPLDATSPVFFPTSYHPLHGTWEAMPSHSKFQMYASLGGLQAEFWPEGSNAFDIRADELGNHGLRFEYEDHVLTPGVDEERNRCPSRNDSLRSLDRRMSLPALKCLWPGSE